jgi:hypothetical protein
MAEHVEPVARFCRVSTVMGQRCELARGEAPRQLCAYRGAFAWKNKVPLHPLKCDASAPFVRSTGAWLAALSPSKFTTGK